MSVCVRSHLKYLYPREVVWWSLWQTSQIADYVNDGGILWELKEWRQLREYSWCVILTGLQMASLHCTYVRSARGGFRWNTTQRIKCIHLTDADNICLQNEPIWMWNNENTTNAKQDPEKGEAHRCVQRAVRTIVGRLNSTKTCRRRAESCCWSLRLHTHHASISDVTGPHPLWHHCD